MLLLIDLTQLSPLKSSDAPFEEGEGGSGVGAQEIDIVVKITIRVDQGRIGPLKSN